MESARGVIIKTGKLREGQLWKKKTNPLKTEDPMQL
jgi:hypothetical protein